MKFYITSNLKYLRTQKNLKQEDIAKILGRNRTLVSAWENNTREINLIDLTKLSLFFNISIDDLIEKDLTNEKNEFDEIEILFDKNKKYLTSSDKAIIKTIIEERKKEIDKETGEK